MQELSRSFLRKFPGEGLYDDNEEEDGDPSESSKVIIDIKLDADPDDLIVVGIPIMFGVLRSLLIFWFADIERC
jgi:hypothetical protein